MKKLTYYGKKMRTLSKTEFKIKQTVIMSVGGDKTSDVPSKKRGKWQSTHRN